jgi:ribosome biogenesis GTPase / thiamine phosphate phosphatase
MPGRRLSDRQKARILTIQDRRRQRLDEHAEQAPTASDGDGDQPRHGLVVVRHGSDLAVEDEQGRVWHCLARQNIGHPVCGDRVVWQASGTERGVVTAIQARATVLARPDFNGRDKALAANLTQLVVILAPRPEPSAYLLDQYLAAAEHMDVKALIACNKTDLLDTQGRASMASLLTPYERIGYPLVWLSLLDAPDMRPLAARLAGETNILVGQSGVGKSSLVKALLPDFDIQIGRLSLATGLGRHTTSTATCYRLLGGGYLIDSPGVRSFRLTLDGPADLEDSFRDIAPLIGHCRFANCRHDQEPGCALKEAVAEGDLNPERMANFLHMAAALERSSARR